MVKSRHKREGAKAQPIRSWIVRTWAQGTRTTLCGGVRESRSSRWGSWADAEQFMDSTVGINGGPDLCGSEILSSTLHPELYRHCAGHPCQAIGCTCFGCGKVLSRRPEYVYGCFLSAEHSPSGREQWGMTRDLREAEGRKAMPGWTVRRMTWIENEGGGGWDSPTFYALSEPF